VPLVVLFVAQEWSVTRQFDDIGVAFNTGQVSRLSDGVIKPVVLRGVFTDKDFRPLSVKIIIAMVVVQEPVGTVVIMFIHGIQVVFAAEFPQGMVVTACIISARGADNLNGGILGTNCVGNQHESFSELGYVIFFVAQAQVFQFERRGVTHVGPDLAPGGAAVAVGKFYQIKGIVYPFLHLIHWSHFTAPELTGNAHGQHWQGFAVDVFTIKEVFVESQSISLVIAPQVPVGFALRYIPHGMFPSIGVGQPPAV